MGSGNSAEEKGNIAKGKIAGLLQANSDNLCLKTLNDSDIQDDFVKNLTEQEKAVFLKCVQTGYENPDSSVGCYAMRPEDYDTFGKFFDRVIKAYHDPNNELGDDAKHETSWDTSNVGDNGKLDLKELGLENVSMRVRVGRNLTAYDLPGKMTKEDRINFEKKMLTAFAHLTDMPEFGGNVYSLTPDFGSEETNPNLIDTKKYNELVAAHIMFKDMDADKYLKSAGISSAWPYGRGCWVSEDKQCIVWFGEEDHLRIMCMKKGNLLNEVFDSLKTLLDAVESIDGIEFAKSEKYGYVTSCPTNLGTGMRASVHVKVPNLTADRTDAKAKEIAKPLGLSVRGTGGEHTPIGADGTVDISPSARLFIKENQIIENLYNGIKQLMAAEKSAAPATATETPA